VSVRDVLARTTARRFLAWWSVSVEPSFARSWAVGAVHERSGLAAPTPTGVGRGFVADATGAAVAPLAADDVLDALGRLNRSGPSPPRGRGW